MMIVVTVRRERRWTPAGTTPLPANLRPIPAQRDLRHSANCFHQPCKPLDRGDYNRCGVLQMTTRTCAVLACFLRRYTITMAPDRQQVEIHYRTTNPKGNHPLAEELATA
jgi:hypothetical protein